MGWSAVCVIAVIPGQTHLPFGHRVCILMTTSEPVGCETATHYRAYLCAIFVFIYFKIYAFTFIHLLSQDPLREVQNVGIRPQYFKCLIPI